MKENPSKNILEESLPSAHTLTPKEIVSNLDKYIIAQDEAKRAVAIALRNRMRRLRVAEGMREEITPKNIIMIGPTGVGKTEISRRLAKLVKAPFVKVEASKFTEVGYVGRDVESIIRDLVEVSYNLVREEARSNVLSKAEARTEEMLLDLLLPLADESSLAESSQLSSTREKLRKMLRSNKLEDRLVEIEAQKQLSTHVEIVGPPGFGEFEGQIKEMFSNMMPKQKEKRKLSISEARKILIAEAQESMIEKERIITEAINRAEQTGIVFIDEIDKICGSPASQRGGPDISREGVQRDLLPLIEGCTVSTKHGHVHTDHILFVASGAFHHTKPSDLMPEFQGRFPIRVELKSLSAEHFVKILTEPQNALTKQYVELLSTEGVSLSWTEDGIAEIANITAEVNSKTENIGARRLHTLLEKLLEEVSFQADEMKGQTVVIDKEYVNAKLRDIAQDLDLSRYIL